MCPAKQQTAGARHLLGMRLLESAWADAGRFVAIDLGFSLCHGRVCSRAGPMQTLRYLLPHFRMARALL
jgi:hypothetical protein